MSQCKPWWKEPWPWLLISGPALAMMGCAVTIWVAMQHADRPIVDGVVRQGLVIRQAATPAGAVTSAAAMAPAMAPATAAATEAATAAATTAAAAVATRHARDAVNSHAVARP